MEFIIFAILFFTVIVIWGLASISQSYAAAKQAQATIEAARVAQTTSAGNLIIILVGALVILIVLAVICFGLWLFYQTRVKPTLNRVGMLPGVSRRMFGRPHQQNLVQQDPMGMLTQVMAMQMYLQMQRDLREQQKHPAQLNDNGSDHWLLP